jgi:hypothetical protein
MTETLCARALHVRRRGRKRKRARGFWRVEQGRGFHEIMELRCWTQSGLAVAVNLHRNKRLDAAYSITSSAMASSVGGTLMPSALAVLRLMTNSNLVGCTTGKSAGLSPLRILPA